MHKGRTYDPCHQESHCSLPFLLACPSFWSQILEGFFALLWCPSRTLNLALSVSSGTATHEHKPLLYVCQKDLFYLWKIWKLSPLWLSPLPNPLNIMMRVYNRNITFIHKTHFFCAVSAKHELYAPKWNRPCNVVMGWWAGYGGEVWFWTSVSLSYFFLQAGTCVSFSEVECGLEKLRQISITFRSRPD